MSYLRQAKLTPTGKIDKSFHQLEHFLELCCPSIRLRIYSSLLIQRVMRVKPEIQFIVSPPLVDLELAGYH